MLRSIFRPFTWFRIAWGLALAQRRNWNPSSQTAAHLIPPSLAICPVCDRALWIKLIEEAEEQSDGRWMPTRIKITCDSEPKNIVSDEWQAWHKRHYSQHCQDWQEIDRTVLEWMSKPEQQERLEEMGVDPEEI